MEPESWWSVTLLRRAHQWTGTLVMDTFAFAMAASLGALAVVPGFKWEAEELTLTMRQTLTQVATKDGVLDLRTFFVELEKEVTPEEQQARTTGIPWYCLLYTSDAADEEDSVDLGGR